MNRKKICFVAQFPPPMHGLSKAVETLYYSQLNSDINSNAGFKFEKINLSNNRRICAVDLKKEFENKEIKHINLPNKQDILYLN